MPRSRPPWCHGRRPPGQTAPEGFHLRRPQEATQEADGVEHGGTGEGPEQGRLGAVGEEDWQEGGEIDHGENGEEELLHGGLPGPWVAVHRQLAGVGRPGLQGKMEKVGVIELTW